jgi:hypothetical protein
MTRFALQRFSPLVGLVCFVLAIGTALAEFETPWSTKLSPEAAAVLHPIERIAFSDDWRTPTSRTGRAGDVAFVILRTPPNSCVPIRSRGAAVTLSQLYPIQIDTPSSEGGRTGPFYEIILPRTAATCTTSRYVLAEWTIAQDSTVQFDVGEARLIVHSQLDLRPRHPFKPFLVGQSNANLIRGHCPGQYCRKEAGLGASYAALLRAHGLSAIQNWAAVPPIRKGLLDLDHRSDAGLSFRQMVMARAPDGLVGLPRARRYADKTAYLRALEATIQSEGLQGQAWVYAVDEPADLDALKQELTAYRLLAPSVKIMVTTNRTAELDPLVDIYAPVLNHLVSSRYPNGEAYNDKTLWTYVSCQGSCGPNRAARPDAPKQPGPDTELPDLLIDRPAQRLFDWFDLAKAHGVSGLLYYEATEGYGLAQSGIDLLSDAWNFGGNGDGLLVFPGKPGQFGLDHHTPLPSFRLKLLRHAIQTRWLKGASS